MYKRGDPRSLNIMHNAAGTARWNTRSDSTFEKSMISIIDLLPLSDPPSLPVATSGQTKNRKKPAETHQTYLPVDVAKEVNETIA